MKYLILITFCLATLGCKVEKSIVSGEVDGDYSIPPSSMNALTALPYSQSNLKFYTMGMQPLTNPENENSIMVCTPGGETCWSTCVSVYFPSVERFSVFKTDWLQGNKCVAYALQYPNGNDVPKMFYYEGTYAGSTCTINTASPDFAGRGVVTEVRVPDGQMSPHLQQKRLYEIQNYLDLNENFISSVYLDNFRPPSSWDYTDTDISPGYITPQLVNGFSCIREDQIQ